MQIMVLRNGELLLNRRTGYDVGMLIKSTDTSLSSYYMPIIGGAETNMSVIASWEPDEKDRFMSNLAQVKTERHRGFSGERSWIGTSAWGCLRTWHES